MLDALYALLAQIGPVDKKDYQPSHAIRSSVFHDSHSATLTVVFLSWRSPRLFSESLTRTLSKSHTDIVVYDFNPYILNSDKKAVRETFEYAASQIARDVAAYVKTRAYTNVDLIGFSLGTVVLSMTAAKLPLFRDVTMIVPGPEVAETLWHGLRTQKIRRASQRKGDTKETLAKEWMVLAPELYAPVFADHNVRITLAKRDRFVPYRFGTRLADALEANGARTLRSISPHGHVMTLVRAAKYLK